MKSVAQRAGITVRLLFHHFEDINALYRLAARTQFERHWSAIPEIPANLPLDARVARTVAQRAKLFETISPVRRSGIAMVTRSEAVAEGLELSNAILRTWLETTFAPELERAGRSRRELLAMIDAATCWESWERLRTSGRLSPRAAQRAMTRMLEALVESAPVN